MPGFFSRIKGLFVSSVDGVMGLVGSNWVASIFGWTKVGSLSLYAKSLYANAAIKKRAEKTGEIRFRMMDGKGEKEVTSTEAAQWLALLEKPNEWQTGPQFWSLAQKYYDTVGACYILKDNRDKVFKKGSMPSRLIMLRADLVEPVLSADGLAIEKFRYTLGNTSAKDYKPEEVIYWYNPSPAQPLIGESLLSAAATAIESEHGIATYHANVLKNGGKLETIFKVKNLTTAEQLKQLEENYVEKYTEAKELGRPLFMGGDIEQVTTALSPQELAYLDTKVSNYRDLAMATGVPKELLADTSGTTYANADASIRIFLREVVKPNMASLCAVLDWRLIPDGMTLSFIDPTPEDKEETRKDLETAHKIEALTTNEMRERLGMEPLNEEEADAVMIPFSKRPLGEIIEPVAPSAAPAATDEPKDNEEKKAVKNTHPLRNRQTRHLWAKAVDRDRQEYDRRMLAATKRFFSEQKERVLATLKVKRKVALDEVFTDAIEISLAKASLVNVIRDIFIEQGEKVADTFGLPRLSLTQEVERSLRERADLFTNSIIATQKDKLSRAFADSLAAEEPRAKLVERIQEIYSDVSQEWANVIARTEVHAAVSNANLQAYYQGGLKIKIWTAVMDERTRPEHADMDGEEVALDAPFSNGLQYPSEPNCRCTI